MTPPTELSADVKDIAYDAMCVWEWFLEARLKDHREVDTLMDRYGTHTVREQVVGLLPAVREAFDRAKAAGYEECFDWEFVPWFMENCVDLDKSAPTVWVCDLTKLPPGCEAPDRDGFAIFCDMLCGRPNPVGTTSEDGKPTVRKVFDTEREAQLDLADALEEHLRQFKEGERDYDEVGVSDMYVQAVTVHPDGHLTTERGTYPPPEQH